jgi:hypothetical protein
MGRQESWVTSDTKEHFSELLNKFQIIVTNNAISRTTTNSVNGQLVKTTEQENLQCYPVAVITLKKLLGKPFGRTGIKEYPIGTQFILVQGERWQQRTPVNLLGDSLDTKWIPVDITFTEDMQPEDKIWSDFTKKSDTVSENDFITLQDISEVFEKTSNTEVKSL